jgi:hypothetical protein
MKNNNHDLIHHLSEMLDSIWRFEEYKRNAKGCKNCQKLWEELKQEYQKWEKRLVGELEKHFKAGMFE